MGAPSGSETHDPPRAAPPSTDTDMDQQYQKRRQRKACDICRRRKVRCDIVLRSGGPCSVCEKAGVECRPTTEWAKPRRRPAGSRPRPASPRAAEEDLRYPSSSVTRKTSVTSPSARDEHGRSPSSPATAAASSRPTLAPAPPHHRRYAQNPHAVPTPSPATLAISPESGREELARNALARFFRQGISAGNWSIFDTPDNFRIAYVGTPVSNLNHLVALHRSFQQRPLTSADGTRPAFDAGSNRSHSQGLGDSLHYPYPPIRPGKPWKPNPGLWGFSPAQDLAADVSSFPAPEVRDALVDAFFEHVHPFLPVISKPDFMAAYRTPSNPPPLLLFQAVLMAGAHACTHPLVANDRHTVKSILFRRASMLYHARHEINRIHLIQAAVLFTWHVGDGDTVSGGPWYWAGIAVRIACGLGTHRRSTALPPGETAQYRRCWWAAFVCEVMSSLETGRPCSIRAEDIDQATLTDEDMTDPLSFTTPPSLRRSLEHSRDTATDDRPRPDFMNRMVELAYIGLDILAVNAPRQERLADVDSISARLGLWSLRSGISSASDDNDASTCHLRMHYNMMLLHLHRTLSDDPGSQSVCSTSARAIIASLDRLESLNCLPRCHFTSVSAATAAGIQLANEIRAAGFERTFLVVIQALEQLARLLRCVKSLAAYWPNAEAVHSVFQELHEEYQMYVAQDLQGERVIIPDGQPDWNRLLAGVQENARLDDALLADQDWLNIPDWSNLM